MGGAPSRRVSSGTVFGREEEEEEVEGRSGLLFLTRAEGGGARVEAGGASARSSSLSAPVWGGMAWRRRLWG